MARATRGRDLTVLNKLSNRRDLGTCRTALCLAAKSNNTWKTDDAEEIRNRCRYGNPGTHLAAQSQGIPGGMEREAAEGSAVGGPVGKVVGGVLGGARGLRGANERLAFREYVMREGCSSPVQPEVILPG